jgi:hypothetical protein
VLNAIRAAECGSIFPLVDYKAKAGVMLIFSCPTTGKVVRTNIETSEAELRPLSELKLSLWCPYCRGGHAILGKDTQIGLGTLRPAA